jgi:hypothetical protein
MSEVRCGDAGAGRADRANVADEHLWLRECPQLGKLARGGNAAAARDLTEPALLNEDRGRAGFGLPFANLPELT